MECNRCNRLCSPCAGPTSSFAPVRRNTVACSEISEPEAPTLSLGERVFWAVDHGNLTGIVRWIGRVPQLCHGWSVGVEFDFPILNGGNGSINGRRYFSSPDGHALFLPSAELDLESSFQPSNRMHNHPMCSENGTEGYCSPHAMPYRDATYGVPYRDATYGHFKQSCHCSNFSRNEHPCSSQGCGPVYGRISARQSLRYHEHPYEDGCSQVSTGFQRNRPMHHSPVSSRISEEFGDYDDQISNARLSPAHSPQCCIDRNSGHYGTYYQNGNLTPIDLSYKHSFFNPRSTIRLISGFKEWVSCWVLGTSRRKKKQRMLLNGRKTVTSLIVSPSSQSMNKTGQRLSSFSNYSSIDYCTLRKNNQKEAKSQQNELSQVNVSMSTSKAGQSESSTKKIVAKSRRYKKRPAPLPPSKQFTDSTFEGQNTSKSGNKNKSYTIVTNVSTVTIQSQNGKLQNGRMKGVASNNSLNTFHRSGSVPSRKCHKKRKAPMPPIPPPTNIRNSEINLVENGNNSFQVDGNLEILYNSTKDDNFKFIDGIEYADRESSNRDSRRLSISDEESEGELRNGITSYPFSRIGTQNGEPSFADHFNVFPGKNDTRFKISIEKREMNVVTVEEVPPSSDAEGEDNDPSSLSEASDSEGVQIDEEREVEGINEEQPKSSSSEESSKTPDPKPIFKELQLTPPPKACVKDFVNAFNMLADRERRGEVRDKRPPESQQLQQPAKGMKSPELASAAAAAEANSKCIQSFPTKWQFQKNSKFLLPIEEESHNEQSESESNAIAAKAENSPPQKSKTKFTHKTKHSKLFEHEGTSENVSKPIAQNDRLPLKQFGKHNGNSEVGGETFIQRTNKDKKIDEKSSFFSSQNPKVVNASAAAVASLLPGKPFKGLVMPKGNNGKMKSWSSAKASPKLDQPIMVSLYIEDKSSHRGPMPLLVNPSMTLRKLKKQVEKEYSFDKDLQCWILGETFAIHDEATLASYGVIEAGYPILLYVMSMESQTKSLPLRKSFKARRPPIYDDVAESSSNSDIEDVENLLDRGIGRSFRRSKHSSSASKIDKEKDLSLKQPLKHPRLKAASRELNVKSEYHATWEKELPKKKDYHALVELDDIDLVTTTEEFECSICFMDINIGDGAVLQECLHSFCKECLAAAIEFSETAVIKCPFRNEEYSCESHLQEREIKSLVLPTVFEKYLQRSMVLAESQASDSFHCKTPDCPGWCMYEDNVNTFLCPVCKKTNCVTCAAVHEGRNCRQYQDDVANRCDSSEEAKKTKEYLENMVKDGEAMKCPKCEVILMKKWGCDWLKCSMCLTEVCWVTKGPRWGPAGRGDTSAGCKCMLNGVRCHPKCNYCH